jgi:hypothetical protein
MTADEAKAISNELQKEASKACEVARTAQRNNQSLKGDNFYGNKFHESVIALSRLEAAIKPTAVDLGSTSASALSRHIATLKSDSVAPAGRSEALKQLRLIIQSELLPMIETKTASPVPRTEQVLPLSVVQATRNYLERIITQANGCYEHQWFDACSVMIRKFVEILIIEVYEANGKADEIKDSTGEFCMLRDLVSRILSQKHWNLSRETKRELPSIKSLGDRSAHNRRFLATKADVDKVIPGLRVIADDLLHLAKLK